MVHKGDGSDQVFVESNRGLYFTDVSETGFLFNTTAAIVNNNYKYSSRDYSKAKLARKIQRIISRLSINHFIHLVENNLLTNFPVTKMDILAAEHIFGPDLGSLKGSTT